MGVLGQCFLNLPEEGPFFSFAVVLKTFRFSLTSEFFFKNSDAKLKSSFLVFAQHNDVSSVEFRLILIYIAFTKTKR